MGSSPAPSSCMSSTPTSPGASTSPCTARAWPASSATRSTTSSAGSTPPGCGPAAPRYPSSSTAVPAPPGPTAPEADHPDGGDRPRPGHPARPGAVPEKYDTTPMADVYPNWVQFIKMQPDTTNIATDHPAFHRSVPRASGVSRKAPGDTRGRRSGADRDIFSPAWQNHFPRGISARPGNRLCSGAHTRAIDRKKDQKNVPEGIVPIFTEA
ncbi:exported hypothetical protein [Frankia sp. AiPs1]